MITKPNVSTLVPQQLPEFVRNEYGTFVSFLQAYYDYLETTQIDITTVRDVDTTLDTFLKYFKDELISKFPLNTAVDQRVIMKRAKDLYQAKGTESAVKLLFEMIYGKQVSVFYPSTQVLRPSDNVWNQDTSLFVQINSGNPDDIVGAIVQIISNNKITEVTVQGRQNVKIEVDRAIEISPTIYEYLIDRRFFGNINIGDIVRYQNTETGVDFSGTILPTTSSLQILEPGTGFKVGDVYPVTNFDGTGTILKIARVDSNGGIAQAQFIQFGTKYTTNFTQTISSDAVTAAVTQATGVQLTRSVTESLNGLGVYVATYHLGITEFTNGFAESGSINAVDYEYAQSLDVMEWDPSYAGETLRQFGLTSAQAVASSSSEYTSALIQVNLGAIAVYPGYWLNNASFLDDAIFIQDSHYYQPFSYVIQIDEKLDTYKTAVKNLIHPAGMAMFGEYNVQNTFSLNIQLQSILKILNESLSDSSTILEYAQLFTSKPLSETQTLSDYARITTSKPFADSQSLSDVLVKLTTKVFTDTQTITDAITSKRFGKLLTESQTMAEAIGPFTTTKALADAPVMSDTTGTNLNRTNPQLVYTTNVTNQSSSTVTMASAGFVELNPYSIAGYFTNDTGYYVGTPTSMS
jgi:hypothetical protein